jgi:hypothetical protein
VRVHWPSSEKASAIGAVATRQESLSRAAGQESESIEMNSLHVPDLDGWEAYCENCDEFLGVRRSASSDDADGTEYFEFVCVDCSSVLLTIRRERAKDSS